MKRPQFNALVCTLECLPLSVKAQRAGTSKDPFFKPKTYTFKDI